MVEEGNRSLALDKIRKLSLSFGFTDTPLFVDNIRLVAGKESSQTLSHIDPHDCMVVIDNRNVYTELAGPAGKIKTDDNIFRLRKRLRKLLRNSGMRSELSKYKASRHSINVFP